LTSELTMPTMPPVSRRHSCQWKFTAATEVYDAVLSDARRHECWNPDHHSQVSWWVGKMMEEELLQLRLLKKAT
jgi:hypothetical protein